MSAEVLRDLQKAILEYNGELAVTSAKKVIEQGIDLNKALETMTDAVRQVGDGFERGELWLPDLIGASDTMLKAMPIIEDAVSKAGGVMKGIGKVVIGTVYGDIHNIGKDMVATLLRAAGFVVEDLGMNVSRDKFVDAVRRHRPDVLAMSALMTTTVTGMRDVIEGIKEAGLRDKVKVIVGGAPVTEDYAQRIGADGYDPTAPGAPKLAKRLLGV